MPAQGDVEAANYQWKSSNTLKEMSPFYI